jgi:hypothetical protein
MSLWRIFRWPVLIGALTTTGLIGGLVSDGWGDVLAALGLFVPVAVAVRFGLRRHRAPASADSDLVDAPRTKPSAPG